MEEVQVSNFEDEANLKSNSSVVAFEDIIGGYGQIEKHFRQVCSRRLWT